MKRLIDVVAAACLLMLLSPVMLVVAIVIAFESGMPVIFRQDRVGRFGRLFVIYKFRTMRQGTPDVAKSDLGAMRNQVTPLGRFLRRTSLDELPQLVNVLTGDMSLVGPRPALYNQHELNQMREEAGVHALRPGITGLAQVNGREELSLSEKVRLDATYLARQSLAFDLYILFRTVRVLFSPRGTY